MNNGKWNGYIKCTGMMLCMALLCFNNGEQMSYIRNLPDEITCQQADELRGYMGGILCMDEMESRQVSGDMSESLNAASLNVSVFGIPVKQVHIEENKEKRLMPGGVPIGVSIYTDGVLVVGLGSVKNEQTVCPAAEGGIKAGDVIVAVNGEQVTDSAHLSRICAEGGRLDVTVRRDEETKTCIVTPAYDEKEDVYLAGMWVRDSTSGIGTLSFWDMDSGRFGALGHPITDTDTGSLIGVKSGSVMKSSIIGINAGSNGVPGEMIGSFSVKGQKWGDIDTNCECGIYGSALDMPVNTLYPEGLPVAWWNEIHTGPAEIMCTVSDEGLALYECEIVKLYPLEESGSKGIVLRVTSPELISITGGIVQGMSGSPIIQDGKIIGAVTHVLVNDPTRGYGIFIENMLGAAE